MLSPSLQWCCCHHRCHCPHCLLASCCNGNCCSCHNDVIAIVNVQACLCRCQASVVTVNACCQAGIITHIVMVWGPLMCRVFAVVTIAIVALMMMALLQLSMYRCLCYHQDGVVVLVTMALLPLICNGNVSLIAMALLPSSS